MYDSMGKSFIRMLHNYAIVSLHQFIFSLNAAMNVEEADYVLNYYLPPWLALRVVISLLEDTERYNPKFTSKSSPDLRPTFSLAAIVSDEAENSTAKSCLLLNVQLSRAIKTSSLDLVLSLKWKHLNCRHQEHPC